MDTLLFKIFLNNILRFNEKTDICNFANDNTIYSYAWSLKNVTENLNYDLKIVFHGSKIIKWCKILNHDLK